VRFGLQFGESNAVTRMARHRAQSIRALHKVEVLSLCDQLQASAREWEAAPAVSRPQATHVLCLPTA